MQYSIIKNDDDSYVTVFIPGIAAPLVAHSSHPNFSQIVSFITTDESIESDEVEYLVGLFDVAISVSDRFDRLSERVSVSNGRIYFDGDEVDNALTKQVVRFLSEGVEDWEPLVAFFENVQMNPQPHSREQLYRWLDRHAFTITSDGMIVGYKGCNRDGDGILRSLHSGPAIVDGEPMVGHVPNEIGSTIEIGRSQVHWDPSVGCSTGLHVGTYEYALDYARNGALLQVHVNPRDVVSVPTDCNDQKVRVCRYEVIAEIEAKIEEPFFDTKTTKFVNGFAVGATVSNGYTCKGIVVDPATFAADGVDIEDEEQFPPLDLYVPVIASTGLYAGRLDGFHIEDTTLVATDALDEEEFPIGASVIDDGGAACTVATIEDFLDYCGYDDAEDVGFDPEYYVVVRYEDGCHVFWDKASITLA